jgi:hypothetical protein
VLTFRHWGLILFLAVNVPGNTAKAQSSPVEERDALLRLEQSLRALHAKLASSTSSSIGLTGSRATTFDAACSENANYVRTVLAAVQMMREKPNLLNSFHASVALTGLQYDLDGLLLAAEMTGTAKSKVWSASSRMLVDDVNKLGDSAYASAEASMIRADH